MKLEEATISEYQITLETIDGAETSLYKWQAASLECLTPFSRPFNEIGICFYDNDKLVFIPWHQIKRASLKITKL